MVPIKKFILRPETWQRSNGDGAIFPKDSTAESLIQVGYLPIDVRYYHRIDPNTDEYYRIIGSITSQASIDDLVIVQYPTYCGNEFDEALLRSLRSVGIKTAVLLHDMDAYRFSSDHHPEKQIKVLNASDLVIIASSLLGKRLLRDGLTTPYILRGPWDYVAPKIGFDHKNTGNHVINYAGNLSSSKAGFLIDIEHVLHMPVRVWGEANPATELLQVKGFEYQGSQPPENLEIKDGWGLVYSNQIEGQSMLNDYEKYNYPAKLALYLRNALPVLVASNTNIARYVSENHLGLVFNRLSEIPTLISRLSEKDLTAIKEHCYTESIKMETGYYTKQMARHVELMLA